MLVSDDFAVIPIGTSCTHGFQLGRLRPILEDKLGCHIRETSSYFRWIYQEPSGIADVFGRYIMSGVRISERDLGAYQDRGCGLVSFLKTSRSWFVHDPLITSEQTNSVDPHGPKGGVGLEDVASKYNHLLDKMRSLGSLSKRIFIFGNSDTGPRSWSLYRDGLIEWYFTKTDVENICASVSKCYPNGENIFIFVANRRNVIEGLDCCILYVEDDFSFFLDDNDFWDAIFDDIPNSMPGRMSVAMRNRLYLSSISPKRLSYNSHSPNIYVSDCVVRLSNSFFYVNSQEGIAIWGPYEKLSAGEYEASIKITAESIRGGAVLEVTAQTGEVLVAQVPLDSMHIGLDGSAKVRFVVGEEIHRVETRLRIYSHFEGYVENISIAQK
ncbi:hypothetical protein ACYJW8_01870 [Frateuria aurantia]